MVLGCWKDLPRPPWEMSSVSLRRNTKSSTSIKISVVPCLLFLTKALLSALPQTIPGTLPIWQLGSGCTDLLVILQGIFIYVWIHFGFFTSHVNQWASLHPSINLFCVLWSSSTNCFDNVAFMNTQELCCVLHTQERGRKCSLFHCSRRNTSFQEQSETLLWEKQVPACRVGNEQEGLGLWKGT